MNKGLDVRGMDASEISRILEPYVSEHFNGFKLDAGQSLFMEGILFHFEEVQEAIPTNYHNLFTDENKFICLSGYVNACHAQGEADTHVIMLLMDENSEYAYFLFLQETGENDEDKNIIIKDFLSL